MAKAERKVFGKLQNTYDPPDLIEIQTKSYNDFLQADVPPAKRENKGLQAIFREIFPVASFDGRYVLDFVGYEFSEGTVGAVLRCSMQFQASAGDLTAGVQMASSFTWLSLVWKG